MLRHTFVIAIVVGCGGRVGVESPVASESQEQAASERRKPCALIETDDDIPSGSATAGALYVADAELGRRLLTADVVAVARGFMDGGIACVHVLDSHDGAIDPGPVEEVGARLLTPSNSAWTWPFFGAMDRPYTMAALVGFHAPAGTDGMRPHTINDAVRRLRIDHEAVGEVAHVTMGLAAFGIPVVVASGDAHATAEAQAATPDVAVVTVRWREEDGSTGFMSAEAAGRRLYEAARIAAVRSHEVPSKRGPVFVELEAYATDGIKERATTLASSFSAHLEEAPYAAHPLGPELDREVFAGAQLSTGGRLTWTAPNALTAFVSIAVAASHLRGRDNWNEVTRGYEAYVAGDHEAAIEAYGEALQRNPHDVATHCRLGAALHARGAIDRAREEFAYGYARISQVGGTQMKAWCALGMAEVAADRQEHLIALEAALQVLALSDRGARQARALAIVQETLARTGRHDGPFPIEGIAEPSTRRRVDAATIHGAFARVGQLVASTGRRSGTDAELAAAHARDCTLPRRRRFNARLCEALEDRRCEGARCSAEDVRACPGVFVDRGLFVSAAECVGVDARVLRHAWNGAAWSTTACAVRSIEEVGPVAVAHLEDDQDTRGPIDLAPDRPRRAPVFVLAFPPSVSFRNGRTSAGEAFDHEGRWVTDAVTREVVTGLRSDR